ncbi:MAG: MFS transporter, partial [Candidatus Nanopelagicaceae bacterium]
QMAGDAGMMVGPVLLGFISDAFSYRTAIGVSAAVFSLAIIVALKIPETNSAHLGDSRKPPINEV